MASDCHSLLVCGIRLPLSSFLGWIMAKVCPYGSPYTERTCWYYEAVGLFVKVQQDAFPEEHFVFTSFPA